MLADLYKETAVYDPLRRTLRYEPQPGCNDDVLHALTYALAYLTSRGGNILL
jgi:hypothetical protein